jgi:hypothetical protein
MAIDIKKFTKHLYDAADKDGFGTQRCGEFVRKALQAGGAQAPFPPIGGQFGPTLKVLGFRELAVADPDTFNFRSGDVMVMDAYKGGRAGHVAGYNGEKWISDFVQKDFWAGPKYRKERPHYAVYRF